MDRGERLVHGDMHSRETEYGSNVNGDEETLPEREENRVTKHASTGDLCHGTI